MNTVVNGQMVKNEEARNFIQNAQISVKVIIEQEKGNYQGANHYDFDQVPSSTFSNRFSIHRGYERLIDE